MAETRATATDIARYPEQDGPGGGRNMRVIHEVEEEGEGTRPVERARTDGQTRAAEDGREGNTN